jgi:hypothetical protein
MKKLLFTLTFAVFAMFAANAQDTKTVVKNETTTKPTSTVKQKVHNTFSKHKEHSGTKTTHKRVVEKKTTAQ